MGASMNLDVLPKSGQGRIVVLSAPACWLIGSRRLDVG